MLREILYTILLILLRVVSFVIALDSNANENYSKVSSSLRNTFISSSEFVFKKSVTGIKNSELLTHIIKTNNSINAIQNVWNNSSTEINLTIFCQEKNILKSMISNLIKLDINHEEISQCDNKHLFKIQTDENGVYKLLYHNVLQSVIDLMIFWKKHHGIFLIDHYSGLQVNQLRRYLKRSNFVNGEFDIIVVESKFVLNKAIANITQQFLNFIIICNIQTTTRILEQAILDNRFNTINSWIIASPKVPEILLSTIISTYSLVTVLAYKFSKLNFYANKNKVKFNKTSLNLNLTIFEQHLIEATMKTSLNVILTPEDKIAQELIFATEIEFFDVFYSFPQNKAKFIKFAKWNPLKGLHVLEFFEPEDNIEKLSGRTVKVAGFVHLPYVTISHTSDGKPVFTGYMWDMIVMIMHYFNANVTYEAQREAIWGILLNGSYTGLLDRLYKKEVDVSMNGYSKLLDRSAVLNYLAPMSKIDFSMTYQTPQAHVPPTTYLNPFSDSVWILIFATLVITTIALALAMLWSPEWELTDIPSVDVHSKKFRILTWTFLEEALEDPPGISARIIFGAVLIGAMGSFILYTSVFTSFLAYQDLKLPIKSLDDLVENKEYDCVIVGREASLYRKHILNQKRNEKSQLLSKTRTAPYMSHIAPFSMSAREGIYKKFWDNKLKGNQEFSLGKSIHDGVKKMLEGVTVFVGDGPSIIETMNNNCTITVMRTKLMRDDLFMVTRSDFPYSRIFYIRMLRIKEGGIMNRLGIKYHIVSRPPCDTGIDATTASFGISQVVGVFFLLFCAIILTILITVIECYINKKKIKCTSVS